MAATFVAPAHGQTPGQPPAGEPTLSVITFGPGDHPFSKFGHDALLLHDPARRAGRQDVVFNYGTFRFDSPWLIVDFLKGKLSYWLSKGSLPRTVEAYRAANRSVHVQRLSLPAAEVRRIAAFLFDNARPENREYRYDYYRDNCATRIRDVLDRHLGGRLREASQSPARMTYREHTRRLTAESPLLYFALDLAMGPMIDQPITEWQAMFLPDRVAEKLSAMQDASGQPLVASTQALFQADRPPTPDQPPSFRWVYLLWGAAVGLLLAVVGYGTGKFVRFTQAFGLACVGLVAGVLALLLLVLWLFTDHDVTYWNRNVLLCPLWALALPVCSVGFARHRVWGNRWMMGSIAFCLSGALAAGVLATFTRQSSTPALCVWLPIWWGAAWGVWQRLGRPRVFQSANRSA